MRVIRTKEQQNAETLGTLYIYIYISVLYATSGIRLLDSNRLEKVAQICDARNLSVINKIDKHKRIDYIANRRKEKLLFTG